MIPVPDFSALDRAFEENFSLRGEVGASVSVWKDGVEVFHRSGGSRTKEEVATWHDDTLVPVWSATKGPAALTLLLALHSAGLTPETPVQHVWPELRTPCRFSQLLSHQAGLSALTDRADALDHAAVADALARQERDAAPLAYHPRTFGYLLEECCRRITGKGIGPCLEEWITGPLEAEFFIGLPSRHHHRVACLYPGPPAPMDSPEAEFYRAFADAASLTRRSFQSPAGLHAVADFNTPAVWSAGLAAMGGVGSARGLGKIYALLAGDGSWQGRTLIPQPVLDWCRTPVIQDRDRVLCMENRFSCGFMLDPLDSAGGKMRRSFGPGTGAYGHPGAGGSLAWADPATGVAFAYVMNRMEPGVLPSRKALALVESLPPWSP